MWACLHNTYVQSAQQSRQDRPKITNRTASCHPCPPLPSHTSIYPTRSHAPVIRQELCKDLPRVGSSVLLEKVVFTAIPRNFELRPETKRCARFLREKRVGTCVVIQSWSEMYTLVHTRQKHNLIMSATTHTFRIYTFCSRLCKRTIVNVLQHAQRQSQTLASAIDLRMRFRLPVKSMAHWFRLQVATTATVEDAMTSLCS